MFNLTDNQIKVGREAMFETIDHFVTLSNGEAREFDGHEARFTPEFFVFLSNVFEINFVNDTPRTPFDFACIIFNNPSKYYIFDISHKYEEFVSMRDCLEHERIIECRKLFDDALLGKLHKR